MATTKKELVDRIAGSTGTSQALAKATIQELLAEVISGLIKGNHLEFRDSGVFAAKTTPARTAQNPESLKKIPVPAKGCMALKKGRLMRETLPKKGLGVALGIGW
jgi:nucleoid DNA-binding protein